MKLPILFTLFLLSLACVQAETKVCKDLPNENVWLWPNAHISAKHNEVESSTLYLLQGNFQKKTKSFVTLGLSPHPMKKKLVLVYRLQALPDTQTLLQTFLKRAEAWKIRGVQVSGLQVDFDSPTLKLKNYAEFLLKVKKDLPLEYHFSLTGLADWINNGKEFQENLKKKDIAVFYQFYQERIPHRETKRELEGLKNYSLPFYVGLLPEQSLPEEEINNLKKNQNFKGILCFYGEKT